MNAVCEAIRRDLARYVDGECDPRTSYEVARHLPECTACRIVLAKERRLREALDVLPGDAAEDAQVVDRVMDALARTPAPRGRFSDRRLRHGLRLAGLFGAFTWLGLPASRAIRVAGLDGGGFRVAPPAPESFGDVLGILAHAVPMISTALDGWSLPIPALAWQGMALGTVAAGAFASAATLAAAAAVVWIRGRPTRGRETG